MNPKFKAVLRGVPSYSRFHTLWELDQLISKIARLPGVEHCVIGKTKAGEPISMLEIGSGARTCMMIGVPHSDEPLGSLVATYFAQWLAIHPHEDCFSWRWLIVPVLERTGMRLNEGWFNTFENYASMTKTYFRRPTEDQYEWTFPIRYGDYVWDRPTPETSAVMRVLERERPELLYGLHSSTFHDAYYYLSGDLPDVYPELRKLSSKVRIPLADKVPDIPFGKAYAHGFYAMYGLEDYIRYFSEADPEVLKTMKRGACSDEWYRHEVGGFSFNCEVPLYRSSKSLDTRPSGKSLEAILRDRYKRHKGVVRYADEMMRKLAPQAHHADPVLYESTRKQVEDTLTMLPHEKRSIAGSEDRIASNAEDFEQGPLSDAYDMLFLGQVWRVSESICLTGGLPKVCDTMDMIEIRLASLAKSVKDAGGFYQVPLKSAVKMQLGSLLLIADALKSGRKSRR